MFSRRIDSGRHESNTHRYNVAPESRSTEDHMPTPCHFAPFDEHLNELVKTPRWQRNLDDYMAIIFKKSVLQGSTNDLAIVALQIIGHPTRAKIRILARTMYTHWMRMQCHSKDTNVSAQEIVRLVSMTTRHLGWTSIKAQQDFMDELGDVCVEKLRLMMYWYVDVVFRNVSQIPRGNMFMRVMAVVRMITHLFHAGQLRHSVPLSGLRYIATMSPWPDAIAIIYALLHELGPKFAFESSGWRFIECFLTDNIPLTVYRVRIDPVCQLVYAINALVIEWYEKKTAPY